MPLRRYVDKYPVFSLILFWVIVPLAILAIAVTGQVQNRNRTNEAKRLATHVDNRVNTTLCQLTQGAWLERGRIIDGLTLAAIRFVKQNPQPGDQRFLREFRKYHAQVQAELRATKPCPQG